MNVYTHPTEIKEIANSLHPSNLVAFTPACNYYKLKGRYYEWFHEGTGTFPAQLAICEIPASAIWTENEPA